MSTSYEINKLLTRIQSNKISYFAHKATCVTEGRGPIRGNMSASADQIRKYATLKGCNVCVKGVLRCEKMLKCVHDYFVYLK